MPSGFPRLFRLPRRTQPDDVQPGSKIQGVDDAWFSPLQPIEPFAPAGTKPRQFNYELGQNILYTPRTDRIDGRSLRTLADTWPLLRTVIETCKDQILRVPWDIVAIPQPGESSRAAWERSKNDPVLKGLRQFWKYPDGQRPFLMWLRLLLEDLLVIDAAVVYLERDDAGRVALARQLDGATITRLIDARGVTPAPPQPAYQQLVWEVPAQNFTTDDLVYGMYYERPNMLYGFGPVEQLLLTINQGLRRDVMRLGQYTTGNMPEMIAMIADAPMDKIEKFQQYFNSMLAGNLQRRNQAIFLPTVGSGKNEIILPKQNVLADEFDDLLIRLVCYAFSVSPSALQKPMNRASAESVSNTSEEEGLLPKLQWIEGYINLISQVRMGISGYEFRYRTTRDIDELKQAQADKIYVENGIKTINEMRESMGLAAAPDPLADQHLVITARGYVPLATAVLPTTEPADVPEATNGSPRPAQKARAAAPGNAAEAVLAAVVERTLGAGFENVRRAAAASGLEKAQHPGKKLTRTEKDALLAAMLKSLEPTWEALPDEIEGPLADAGVSAAVDPSNAAAAPNIAEAAQSARALARARAAEMVGMRRGDDGTLAPNPSARWAISDTTRDDLREILGRDEPVTQDSLIGEIQSAGMFSPARAKTIASTETKMMGQRTTYENWRRSQKVASVRWNLSFIEPHCPECIANAASGARPIEEQFPSGDLMPPAHPNCRCYLSVDEFHVKPSSGFAGKSHSPETRARIAETMRRRAAERRSAQEADAAGV